MDLNLHTALPRLFKGYARSVCIAFCLIQTAGYANAGDLSNLRSKAEKGDAHAQVTMGQIYARGLEGEPEDPKQAMTWYSLAAAQGNADGKDAVKELNNRIAAEEGDAAAQYKLGQSYARGGVLKSDYKLAFEWNRKAAENGNADAQFDLGFNYNRGYMVPKDSAQALTWFRKAAEQGHVAGQFYVGVAYAQGNGVPQDNNQALMWLRMAAQQGNVAAQRYISQMGG